MSIPIYQKAFDMLRQDEGCRLTAYIDSSGIITIGYGRNLQTHGISRIEAEFLLQNDLLYTLDDLQKIFPNFLKYTQNQQLALINMHINCGARGFREFKRLIQAVLAEDWAIAAQECLDSQAAKQLPDRYQRNAKRLKS